ncbi:putative thiol-disulfide oxidoreductase DCC [Mycobacterium bohemicum DSM 44277]|uniref:Thiol-disulfide oxidoreductase n=2 Tax=Mycobacterium bohemicum TaxID=56425 RepID=A0A1X1QX85_MYCBE|nr:DCC1-like thiol-disulfide oxidoreductase family protein [Mycobacterium bohemicum]MCV6970462.1 DUF393 domain-containing protein [Mycobacterium bohemicum]ORU95916.1 thiol-disulfide oxidoreductase [Mycobacterium bohemicum]CPR10091.1 putative thiol-disulfide oxidoreductase DCC [Mycobacterium bohemicum DSM 44277]
MSVAPVLLYDGVCGVCNAAVQTVLRFDRRGSLRFAALDSDFARSIIDRHPAIQGIDSMVFVDQPGQPGEAVAVRSEAALRVVDYLGGPWRALKAARILPGPVRDRLYDRFATIRYRVFGRHDSCPIPPPEVRARFVDV